MWCLETWHEPGTPTQPPTTPSQISFPTPTLTPTKHKPCPKPLPLSHECSHFISNYPALSQPPHPGSRHLWHCVCGGQLLGDVVTGETADRSLPFQVHKPTCRNLQATQTGILHYIDFEEVRSFEKKVRICSNNVSGGSCQKKTL